MTRMDQNASQDLGAALCDQLTVMLFLVVAIALRTLLTQ